jgi:hypothetical protein
MLLMPCRALNEPLLPKQGLRWWQALLARSCPAGAELEDDTPHSPTTGNGVKMETWANIIRRWD